MLYILILGYTFKTFTDQKGKTYYTSYRKQHIKFNINSWYILHFWTKQCCQKCLSTVRIGWYIFCLVIFHFLKILWVVIFFCILTQSIIFNQSYIITWTVMSQFTVLRLLETILGGVSLIRLLSKLSTFPNAFI